MDVNVCDDEFVYYVHIVFQFIGSAPAILNDQEKKIWYKYSKRVFNVRSIKQLSTVK